MKKVFVLFFVLLSFGRVVFSQNQAIYNDMVSSGYRAAGGNYNKVKVIFSVREGKSVHSATEDIKAHMHMKDPNGFFNPYWITNFPDESFLGNDGVIIGTWYTENYEGWSVWLSKMKARLDDMPELSFYKVLPLGK